jgi:hypothetical protein
MKAQAQRLIGSISLALAAAAIVAGGAQADRPDDRAGMLGVGSVSAVAAPDAFERAVNRAQAGAVPDAFERAVNIAQAGAVPDAFERAVDIAQSATTIRPDDRGDARGPGAIVVAQPAPIQPASHDRFAWGDAAVGAGATLGFLTLGAVFLVATRQRRRVVVS